MPWKESSVMDERIRFVIQLKDVESMALCREFQISRKTGYKIFAHYEELRTGGAHRSCQAFQAFGLVDLIQAAS